MRSAGFGELWLFEERLADGSCGLSQVLIRPFVRSFVSGLKMGRWHTPADVNAAERDPTLLGMCMWILVDHLPRVRLFIIFMLSKRAQLQRVWESTEVSDFGTSVL